MAKPFEGILTWVADNFRKDASKMLIWTGVAGWTISSLAQIGAILVNPKISAEQKSFLVPQEIADAAVNIGSFFLVTQAVKKLTSKLFSTGKFAPQKVRDFLNKNKSLYGKKVGKLDFDLDDVFKTTSAPDVLNSYYKCKNFGTTLATVGAGVVSSNIITPIVRNRMASSMQKDYLDKKSTTIVRPQTNYSGGMKI